MTEDKDNIGKLFQSSFSEYFANPEKGEWEKLQSTMQPLNFFKFNKFQFNVYYAGTILFCFLTCLGVGSHYTLTHIMQFHQHTEASGSSGIAKQKKLSVTQKQVKNNIPSIISAEMIEKNKKIINKGTDVNSSESEIVREKSARTDSEVSKVLNNNLSEHDLNTYLVPQLKSDSLSKLFKHPQIAVEDTAKSMKKRILYITKQDTIYQYDTLRAPKIKKRRFN